MARVRLVRSIVEGNEVWTWPFVDTIRELPFRPAEPLPLPVDDPALESNRDVGAKALPDSAGLVVEAELPGCGEKQGEEVFLVVVAEIELSVVDDPPADRLDVDLLMGR